MLQEIKMTDEEKVAMYMKCTKKNLIEMLLQCNKMLANLVVDYSKYFMGADPYYKLNWWQGLLKKTGLFYRNRPKNGKKLALIIIDELIKETPMYKGLLNPRWKHLNDVKIEINKL